MSVRRQTSVLPEPPRFTSPARPRTVKIIGPDNGAGLSRDRGLVEAAFRGAGWEVTHVDPKARSNQTAVVHVHLEIVSAHHVGARRDIIIPNPEWWQTDWTPILKLPSVRVWTKTRDAADIFARLGARTECVGFRSIDQRCDGERRRAFLHVGGASPNKGTAELVGRWQKDWPPLTVVCAREGLRPRPNVTILRRVSEDNLRTLQNSHWFHIYPSRYEGFGHAQWEGMSCGAVVIVAGGPPFDEYGDSFVEMASVCGQPAKNGLLTLRDVSAESLAAAVTRAMAMSDDDIVAHAARSRAVWGATTADFEQKMAASIRDLDDAQPVVLAPLSACLAEVPPMAYVGRIHCVTGYGAAARHQIHVLRRHGMRLSLVDAGFTHDPDPHGTDALSPARVSNAGLAECRGTIIHLAPNIAGEHRAGMPRPHILVSVWETTRLPVEWVRIANSFDQVWCATEWQMGVYRESGVRPELLRLVPFAVDPDLYKSSQSTPRRNHTVFGSVFQWTERKNPVALLGAYLHAFAGSSNVELLLKSYEGDSPTSGVQEKIDAIVKSYRLTAQAPPIRVISHALDSAGMADFYQGLDCYVSAHRGEGFGLPIAEALLAGRPVIATGWSAPAEYAAGHLRAVGYTLEPPRGMDWQPFYSADQLWAHADVADLARAMREAHAGELVCPEADVRLRFAQQCTLAGEAAASALRELVTT